MTKTAPSRVPPPLKASGPWPYHVGAQLQSLVLDQQATVEIRQDTLTRSDTLSLHVETAFTQSSATNHVAGTVGAYRLAVGSATGVTPAGLTVPFFFAGDFPARGRQLELSQPDAAAACTAPSRGAAQALRDLWLQPPDTLRIGTVWEDSSTYTVCRDGMLLRLTSTRRFRVMAMEERDGRTLLSVARRTTGTIRSERAQSDEPVTIAGVLSGDMTLELVPATGELRRAEGTSLLEFTLTSKLRAQRVRQLARLRVVPGAK